ncbi:MAG: hypothetical protein AAB631_00945 [Patescibacteria group bacterium]
MKSTHDDILELLSFYRRLGRPLTRFEIHRLLPAPDDTEPLELENALLALADNNKIYAEDGFYTVVDASLPSLKRRMQDLVSDMKWKRFLKSVRWLRHVPFVEFALASGSMAFGNVTPMSDFDLLVAVRKGRMFTTRYLINLLFTVLGMRRMNDLHDADADKLCFNHFITEATFEKQPHNFYRGQLYKNFVPLLGKKKAIAAFLKANQWANPSEPLLRDKRFYDAGENGWKRAGGWILGGVVGDLLERNILKPIATRRLVHYIAKKPKDGRVVVQDDELEFHFDLTKEKKSGKLPSRWCLTG